MRLTYIIRLLFLTSLFVSATIEEVTAQERFVTMDIDGDEWQLTRQAEHCVARVQAAVSIYEKEPIYAAWRKPESGVYLVNGSSECWVDLTIQGVDDVSFIFKVTRDGIVTDKRLLEWRGYRVHPYPSQPYND